MRKREEGTLEETEFIARSVVGSLSGTEERTRNDPFSVILSTPLDIEECVDEGRNYTSDDARVTFIGSFYTFAFILLNLLPSSLGY